MDQFRCHLSPLCGFLEFIDLPPRTESPRLSHVVASATEFRLISCRKLGEVGVRADGKSKKTLWFPGTCRRFADSRSLFVVELFSLPSSDTHKWHANSLSAAGRKTCAPSRLGCRATVSRWLAPPAGYVSSSGLTSVASGIRPQNRAKKQTTISLKPESTNHTPTTDSRTPTASVGSPESTPKSRPLGDSSSQDSVEHSKAGVGIPR